MKQWIAAILMLPVMIPLALLACLLTLVIMTMEILGGVKAAISAVDPDGGAR